ncbi:MAG: chorismate synthase [Chloroflexi bacterium]|nr:chorismate synthase [Chloroflexota bacterium]
MSSSFGEKIKIQIFGQSHSPKLGVIIDGLPAGITLDMESIQAFLDRRRGGQAYSTPRAENDIPQIICGIVDGKTCGAPLGVLFDNQNIKSQDYENIRNTPRPSHADLNAHIKYDGAQDKCGGGHFSGRLTLPFCFAGAICLQILAEKGVQIGAHIAQIKDIKDTPYDPVSVTAASFNRSALPVNNQDAKAMMIKAVSDAADADDSIGGIVECAVLGLPQGLGQPMFNGLENQIAQTVFAIPAVKGIEFGAGFAAATMYGSQHNDAYTIEDNKVLPRTNHAGGILGGMSTGRPLIFRAAFKPTPSIAKEQDTVDLQTMTCVKINIKGRHDPCIVLRAVPCVEAAAAIAVINLWEDTAI